MCIIYLVLERGQKSKKLGLELGVTIGGDAVKISRDTHLLVIIRVRLLHKISLLDLTNWTYL